MRLRTVTVVVVVAALVAVIVAVIVANSAGPGARLADNADAGSSAVRDGAGTDAGRASRSPGATTPPGTNKPGTRDSLSGKEGNPSASTPVPYTLPDRPPGSPPPATPQPLVSAPLPATASARGSLVKGFPAVISPAPESTVTFSSVATQGKRVQVGLDATTSASAIAVLSYYRTAFEPLGLVAASAPAVDGSTALSFIRGDNGITVTVSTPADSPRAHYTVTGVFIAGT